MMYLLVRVSSSAPDSSKLQRFALLVNANLDDVETGHARDEAEGER